MRLSFGRLRLLVCNMVAESDVETETDFDLISRTMIPSTRLIAGSVRFGHQSAGSQPVVLVAKLFRSRAAVRPDDLLRPLA